MKYIKNELGNVNAYYLNSHWCIPYTTEKWNCETFGENPTLRAGLTLNSSLSAYCHFLHVVK